MNNTEKTAERLVKILQDKTMTIATAESCTAGLISKLITDISGASAVFPGGAVTYSNEMKMKMLGVNSLTLKQHGAVSAPTAAEMAKGVRTLTGADIGISITGIAGPNSDGTDKPVGLVFIGLADKDKTLVIKRQNGEYKTREAIRLRSAADALEFAEKYLCSYPDIPNEKYEQY